MGLQRQRPTNMTETRGKILHKEEAFAFAFADAGCDAPEETLMKES